MNRIPVVACRARARRPGLASLALGLVAAAAANAQADSVAETVLHSFTGSADGATPQGGLVRGTDGNFYGTTAPGNNGGTIFRLSPSGVLTPLAGSADGAIPAGLTLAANGSFYGVTTGVAPNFGSVFKFTPPATLSTLYTFTDYAVGAYPMAAVIQASDGNFYGTTNEGGSYGLGTVFKLTPAGALTVLHAFAGGADGSRPQAPLTQGRDGALYGSSSEGGANQLGTIFRITAGGAFTTLHALTDLDGSAPRGRLLQAADGNFYGTASVAGASAAGTVFKVTPAGVLSVLHAFDGDAEGADPHGDLLLGADGNFYGTTSGGGGDSTGYGTVFKLTAAGALTTLHVFHAAGDGAAPQAGLIQGSDGAFYGTTSEGGGNSYGTAFRLTDTTPSVGFVSAAEQTPSGSGGLPAVQIELSLSAPSLQPVTVPYTLGGSEPASRYTASPAGSVTIAAGDTSATITVQMKYSTVLQCDHDIVLTLGKPTFATLGQITSNTLTVHNYALRLPAGVCSLLGG